jgi:hypothetical protein
MISSEISKRLTEGLKQLRAITEPTIDSDQGISVSYYAEHNNAATEEEVYEKTDPNQLTFWDNEGTVYGEIYSHTEPYHPDMCYAQKPVHQSDSKVTLDGYKKWYQDVIDAAKEWVDKPSDKKKIASAIEYVLETAKTAPRVNNKLTDRLKHDEMMRIVSKLVEFIKD